MKKTILALLAIAAMASCSKSEIVELVPQNQIAFGNSFVDNSTRAIDNTLNSGTLSSFTVYGSVTGDNNTVNIYSGVEVKKATAENPADAGAIIAENWWYEGVFTQYWIVGNTYKFAAIVNGTAATFDEDANKAENMPLTISYNASEQKDLLYAEHSVASYAKTEGSDVVKFTFSHLLSKAQFTFKNTLTTNTSDIRYTYRVSDVKINNAYMAGTYTIANGGTWAVTTTGDNARGAVSFGNISNAVDANSSADAIQVGAVGAAASATSHNQMLLIPNTYTDLNITCKIETLLNGKVIDTEETHTITPGSITLEAGNAYNFIISKGAPGDPIKFALDKVNNWTPATGGTDTDIQ